MTYHYAKSRLASLLGGIPLFRHHHRYNQFTPGVLIDSLTGHIFPFTKLSCKCGKEEPTGKSFREALERNQP